MKKKNKVVEVQSLEEVHSEFFEQFLKQDDRSAVILAGALVDLMLGALLRKVFLPSPTEKDNLIDERGALSSLHARAIACYRLGLIDADMHRAITLIRDVRIIYAHRLEYSDLSSDVYAAKILEAYSLFSWHKPYVAMGTNIFGDMETAAMQFRLTVVLVAARLKQAINEQAPLHSSTPKTLISVKWTMLRELRQMAEGSFPFEQAKG
jgi:hypothetical protein